MTRPTLVWFRSDLRLADNPALSEAVAAGGEVVPVYILDDAAAGSSRLGGAARWWLHHALASLEDGLGRIGLRLRILRGDSAEAIDRLLAETKAAGVLWNRRYEPWAIAQDKAIKVALELRGVHARSFNASLGREPWEVARDGTAPYKVFTPFWRAWERQGALPRPLPTPEPLGPAVESDRQALQSLELLPTRPDWAGGLCESWEPGEPAAWAALTGFLEGPVERYGADRNFPAKPGVSRLSPRLRHGEISVRQAWHAARTHGSAGAASFIRELVWREFSYHLLYHFPDIVDTPLRPEFARFAWADAPQLLRAWSRGRTGYPIVDAGMRELWHTGYMHNRVRMITASFLIKDLLVPWQQGAAWFWDTLCDADLASNSVSWQWVAGSGADAAPYFRIFNPVSQGEKFDAQGSYVRRWVPELARLPKVLIHQPWQAPPDTLTAAGIELGRTYPDRIVDHGEARARALATFQALRS
ncbi:MAG: deoxyribodipyrimidine photo-lyase [Geminicoccaceae bacterium]